LFGGVSLLTGMYRAQAIAISRAPHHHQQIQQMENGEELCERDKIRGVNAL